MLCSRPERYRLMAIYRLICAVCFTGYFAILFGCTVKYYFSFLTNWGNTALALNYCLLASAHYRAGHYRRRITNWQVQKQSGSFWKYQVLVYECTVLLIVMITIGYWLAIFPTSLVLPIKVEKPGLDTSKPLVYQETVSEQACSVYYMDRLMTNKFFL
jgi:hypothetical protein